MTKEEEQVYNEKIKPELDRGILVFKIAAYIVKQNLSKEDEEALFAYSLNEYGLLPRGKNYGKETEALKEYKNGHNTSNNR